MEKEQVVRQFSVRGEIASIVPYGSGHINDTYLVTTKDSGKRYILQRMNTSIFTKPEEVMENIVGVTSFLEKKIGELGGDPKRETLQVMRTAAGQSLFCTEEREYYRMYHFIEDAVSYDKVENAQVFYECAAAFGRFQYLLADYPAASLHETIPDFHNTPKRYADLEKAAAEDRAGRKAQVTKELEFIAQRKSGLSGLQDAFARGEIPLRVTHNDTKLNNIMMDPDTGKSICIIDLDTVMPGFSLYDFGDAVRYGASTAAEDEEDLSKVSLDLELYHLYRKGYLEGSNGSLTEREVELLPMGAKLMTLECGIRFLEDYLNGDTYFKIHRKEHNLIRCRTQLCLVADMEKKWEQMQEVEV